MPIFDHLGNQTMPDNAPQGTSKKEIATFIGAMLSMASSDSFPPEKRTEYMKRLNTISCRSDDLGEAACLADAWINSTNKAKFLSYAIGSIQIYRRHLQ